MSLQRKLMEAPPRPNGLGDSAIKEVQELRVQRQIRREGFEGLPDPVPSVRPRPSRESLGNDDKQV